MNSVDPFRRGHHFRTFPVIAVSNVHELDQPHLVAGAPEVFEQVHDGVIIHAALDHRVDLQRFETGGFRSFNAFQDFIEF